MKTLIVHCATFISKEEQDKLVKEILKYRDSDNLLFIPCYCSYEVVDLDTVTIRSEDYSTSIEFGGEQL